MPKRILIVGAGLTGLSAAHRILELNREKNLGLEFQILESGDRAGGVIQTIDRDGCVLELGPDFFITTKPWALDLSKRLGLDDRLIETDDTNRRSFVLMNKKLVPLPEGFQMLAPGSISSFLKTPLFTPLGKLRMLLDLVIPKNTEIKDESLASFVRRRLGNEALERAAQPMLGGVYTANPETLSLRATMPQFLEMEQKYGSVIKGIYEAQNNNNREKRDSGARYSMFMSFKNGMRELLEALLNRFPKNTVKYNDPVKEIKRTADGFEVVTKNSIEKADGVIVTTPSFITSTLIKGINTELSDILREIEFASSSILVSVHRKEDIQDNLNGFGFVVPAIENNPLLSCSYLSRKFPSRAPGDQVILRTFVGGALNPEINNLADDEIKNIIEKELGSVLGITKRSLFSILKRYPDAMPQYKIGHIERIDKIENELMKIPGLELAGISYKGVGIPDCVHSGETAAEQIIGNIFNNNSS